jgi:protein TonB
VGPDGRVTDCTVTGSSGSPDLDATACAKIRSRARFNPATDGEGQPTSGTYSNAVRWVIPKD